MRDMFACVKIGMALMVAGRPNLKTQLSRASTSVDNAKVFECAPVDKTIRHACVQDIPQ